MAVVKLVNERYETENDVRRLLEYVVNPMKNSCEVYGGLNIIGSVKASPEAATDQFLCLQSGRKCTRRLYHIIIAFDPVLDNADLDLANIIGQEVCRMYPQWQSIYAVHDNTDHLHIHAVFNNCPVCEMADCLSQRFSILKVQNRVDHIIDSYVDKKGNSKRRKRNARK